MVRGARATLIAAIGACVPYGTPPPTASARFELLHGRALSDFAQQVRTQRHQGVNDARTALGEAWVAFLRCEPVNVDAIVAQDDNPVVAFAAATVALEDARRRRLLARARRDRRLSRYAATLHPVLLRPGFFARGVPESGERVVSWPPSAERWADELPGPQDTEHRCDRLLADAAAGRRGGTVAELVARELDAVEVAIDLADELPVALHSGGVAALSWRLRMHAAVLASGLLGNEPEPQTTRAYLAQLASQDTAGNAAPVSAAEAAAMHLLHGAQLIDQEQRDGARAAFARAESLGPKTARALWAARYGQLRMLSEAARYEEVEARGDALPPSGSPYFAAYAYRLAIAHKRRGAEDRFVAVAKSALRDRPFSKDPFLSALYREVLGSLTPVPFDAQVRELLEELGPRDGTFARAEELAWACLERARPERARTIASWLLATNGNARAHPRYQALVAVAAFHRDDPRGFLAAVRAVAPRTEALRQALPPWRREGFFADADVELSRIMSHVLPAMAEWGDGASAHARRQRWLRLLVAETQHLLRAAKHSSVRPDLVRVYRLASGLLGKHPRGYAERLGTDATTAPLVLGAVHVRAERLRRHEPSLARVPPPFQFLALVPRDDLPPAQWDTVFSGAKTGAESKKTTTGADGSEGFDEGGPKDTPAGDVDDA